MNKSRTNHKKHKSSQRMGDAKHKSLITQRDYLRLTNSHNTDIMNNSIIVQFAELANYGSDKIPYIRANITMYNTYKSSVNNAGWLQIGVDPYALPLFTDDSGTKSGDVSIIFEKANLYVMPKFEMKVDTEDKSASLSRSLIMALTGVPARPSGIDSGSNQTYDTAFFQPQRTIIEPTSNIHFRHISHINYKQLQENQQQLVKRTPKGSTLPATILIAFSLVDPISGKPIDEGQADTFNITYMFELTYLVPI